MVDSAQVGNTGPLRVMLWSVPRSVSTGFLKCMTAVPNSQMWYEPYLMTKSFSTDGPFRDQMLSLLHEKWAGKVGDSGAKEEGRVFASDISGGYLASDKPFSWIKEQLETSSQNKQLLFCKEISVGIDGYYQYIPDGFRHTFLIRHPYKVLSSWERMINRGIEDEEKKMKIREMPEFVSPSGYYFKEQYDLFKHVRENIDPNPIVIDSDDLLADPGRVLKAYCQAVGIPYTDDLLQWQAGGECMETPVWTVAKEQIMIQKAGLPHAETFSSTCFSRPTKLPDRSELSEDVLFCADKSMKYYDEMYARRLQSLYNTKMTCCK